MSTTTPQVNNLTELLVRVNELNRARDCLIVVGGGILQYATFFETARLGLGVILVDGDRDCYCSNLCNYFVRASTREPFKATRMVGEFIAEHPNLRIVGVYTQGCDCEVTVSAIAQELGLPTVGVLAARRCNNKIEMRLRFSEYAIPQPDFIYTSDVNEARDIARRLFYPCVFKSVDNCASRGVTIVNYESQVDDAFESALKNSVDQRVLIEKFVHGKEYSVDTIVYKGVCYPCGISDREFTKEDGHAIQTGSLTPSLLPTDKQAEIYGLMERAAKALGVDNSAFKGDIIIDDNGKVLVIEVTARLSGGFDSQYRKPLSYGINLIKATIDICRGKELDYRDIIPRWVKFSKTFHVFPQPGVIKSIEGLDDHGHIKGVDGIKKIFVTKKVGDVVEYNNCSDRVVHIIGCADTLEQLRAIEKNAQDTLKFVTV